MKKQQQVSKKKKQQHLLPATSSSDETDSDCSSSSSDGKIKSVDPSTPAAGKVMDTDGSDLDSPILAKPKEDASKLNKPGLNPVAYLKKKRALLSDVGDASKRLKKDNAQGTEDEGKKSALFQRLWSDDDEIAVLKGMLEFKESKGRDPMGDVGAFHDFVKKSLHVDFDRTQLVNKVRRLKKRYENSVSKKKFSPHEQAAFDLSKKFWGKVVSGTGASSLKSKPISEVLASKGMSAKDGVVPTSSKVVGSNDEVNSWQFIGKSTISMGLDENIVKLGLDVCSEDKKAEIEGKWKQLYLEESDLLLRKMSLAMEETKMITEALKSAGK